MLAAFDTGLISDNLGLLLDGLVLTLEITALGFAIAVVLGLPLALAGNSRSPLLRAPANCWVALARGVPLLIVIFWLYYAAADKGLFSVRAFLAGVLVARAHRIGLHGRDLPHGPARGAGGPAGGGRGDRALAPAGLRTRSCCPRRCGR